MKNYLLTGGTSGIGECFIKSFSEDANTSIYVIARSREKFDVLQKSFPKAKIFLIESDLSDISSIKNKLEQLKDINIDGIIHCAGIIDIQKLKKTTYDKFLRLMNINFFSFCEILRCIVGQKKNDAPLRVIAMSSIDSFRGDPFNQMYAASKAALDSYIRTISIELNKYNVEINSIQACYVDTPMIDYQKQIHAENIDDWKRSCQPLGVISPEEIVEQIQFFLNKKGKCVTGTSVFINSGIV